MPPHVPVQMTLSTDFVTTDSKVVFVGADNVETHRQAELISYHHYFDDGSGWVVATMLKDGTFMVRAVLCVLTVPCSALASLLVVCCLTVLSWRLHGWACMNLPAAVACFTHRGR